MGRLVGYTSFWRCTRSKSTLWQTQWVSAEHLWQLQAPKSEGEAREIATETTRTKKRKNESHWQRGLLGLRWCNTQTSWSSLWGACNGEWPWPYHYRTQRRQSGHYCAKGRRIYFHKWRWLPDFLTPVSWKWHSQLHLWWIEWLLEKRCLGPHSRGDLSPRIHRSL